MSQPLYYRTWGENDSRALLLIHPLGADHRFWNEAAESLARNHFCISPDLRSSGRSPVVAHPVSLNEHVNDLDGLCHALSVKSVSVIGCAVGAVIAAVFASRASTRTCSAILSNPTVAFDLASREMMAQRIIFAREHGMPALAPQIVERAFSGMPNDEKKQAFLAMVSGQNSQGYVDIIDGIRDADISEELARIKCPVLILTSVNDILLPPDRGNEVARLLSDVRVESIDEGAHFIPYQAAAAFVARADSFLCKQAVAFEN